jgi:hypothetical protein
LALALGKTVRQLLAQISSEELTEWRAYALLEPFGEQVADQRHGIALAALANLHRDPQRRRQPYRPEDFIPWHLSHASDLSEVKQGGGQAQGDAGDGTRRVDREAQSRLIKKLFQRTD